jgi:tRNA(fMet)-specific endonuclease VapC
MKADVLADTSVWIEYFNHRQSESGDAVEALLRDERVVITGIVLTELLQGAKLKNEFDAILDSMLALPFLDAKTNTWIEAGRLSYSLRRKGVTVPTTDVIIASLTLENQCLLFSLDSHFDRIPGIKRYPEAVPETPGRST